MKNTSVKSGAAAVAAGLAIVFAPAAASAMTMTMGRKPPVPITLPLYFAHAQPHVTDGRGYAAGPSVDLPGPRH